MILHPKYKNNILKNVFMMDKYNLQVTSGLAISNVKHSDISLAPF